MAAILSAIFLFSVLPSLAVSQDPVPVVRADYQKIPLVSVTGPESLAFDVAGHGPYTGVSDGRVLKWQGSSSGWVDFCVPSESRNGSLCNGSTGTTLESTCGRPLGLQFYEPASLLYIADAYFGLLVVGAGGGIATQVAIAAEGTPFNLTNGVDVDQASGVVYFTDSSARFQRRDWFWSVVTHDDTGRFMMYDPKTNQVKVLIRGLQFPNGVAISKDGDFVLVAETTQSRVLRYWVRGSRAGTSEMLARVPGYPDNIKRNQAGEFWVGVNVGAEKSNIIGVKLNGRGEIVELLQATNSEYHFTEVNENNGTLWLGSLDNPFVGYYHP